jgi:choline dehydrogenase/4-pyridoxate dehydrogenase
MGAEEFDYVIIGGGSAGCVLASRLSEDHDTRVLLLEAGGRDWHPFIHIPLGVGQIRQAEMFDWGYSSEPQPNLAGRRIELKGGKVLGGSSSVNFMAHNRGNRSDYERWVRLGMREWSYENLLPTSNASRHGARGRPHIAAPTVQSALRTPAAATPWAGQSWRPLGWLDIRSSTT